MRKFAWITLIVGSLCFSVGEGLRLTPFPVSAVPQLEETNRLTAGIAKYGPLDVPSKIRKSSKRQTTDSAVELSAAARRFVTIAAQYSGNESLQLESVLFVSRPVGRAPPLLP
jgi:hypothetical protein